MGLFSKLTKEPLLKRKDVYEEVNFDKSNVKNLLAASLGETLAVTYNFNEYIKTSTIPFPDYDNGIISFGRIQFPFQLIGYEKDNVWTWANTDTFNVYTLKLVSETRDKFKSWNTEFLLADKIGVNSGITSEDIAAIVCSIYDKYCVKKVINTLEEKTYYIAIMGVQSSVFKSVSDDKFMEIVNTVKSSYDVDEKLFIESFLLWNGIKYESVSSSEIKAKFRSEVTFNFNLKDNVYKIESIK